MELMIRRKKRWLKTQKANFKKTKRKYQSPIHKSVENHYENNNKIKIICKINDFNR